MSDFKWEMTDRSIVKKVDKPVEQSSFAPPSFQKAKVGEKLKIDMYVVAEPLDNGPLMKKANVSTNLPGWGVWEIVCDEGTNGGGFDSAPSPLMYFSAGIAFCLLTHIQTAAKLLKIKLDRVRVEQRTTFSTTYNFGSMHPKNLFGAGEQQETHLFIESSETEQNLQDFAKWCEQGCMAFQTVANATPATTYLHLNGENIGSI